jgi:hypothetical protein
MRAANSMDETPEQKLIRLSQTVINALEEVIKAREIVENTFEVWRNSMQRAHEVSLLSAREAHGASLADLREQPNISIDDIREAAIRGLEQTAEGSPQSEEYVLAWAAYGDTMNSYIAAWKTYRKALRVCAAARLAYEKERATHDNAAKIGRKSA